MAMDQSPIASNFPSSDTTYGSPTVRHLHRSITTTQLKKTYRHVSQRRTKALLRPRFRPSSLMLPREMSTTRTCPSWGCSNWCHSLFYKAGRKIWSTQI